MPIPSLWGLGRWARCSRDPEEMGALEENWVQELPKGSPSPLAGKAPGEDMTRELRAASRPWETLPWRVAR